jgi:hypothetical protein
LKKEDARGSFTTVATISVPEAKKDPAVSRRWTQLLYTTCITEKRINMSDRSTVDNVEETMVSVRSKVSETA